MYENITTEGKEYCRTRIYNIAKELPRGWGNRRPRIFTLPSYNFALEEKLSKLPVSLHCAENNREVYKTQIKSSIYKRVHGTLGPYLYHQNLDAFDALLYSTRIYSLIHLDLCQSLQFSLINKWLSFIQKVHITKECYMAITLLGRRENQAKEICEVYNAKSIQEFREKIFPELTIQFAKLANRECKLVELYPYSGEAQSPMNFYLFKIKNHNND